MAKIIGIAMRKGKRKIMQSLQTASIDRASGVENDFRGKPGKRQVTVLSLRAWNEACEELGKHLDWTTRRSNLLIDDIELENSVGKILEIGDIKLKITQETDPCSRMEESEAGLFNALKLHWRGGVCCRVISGGEVSIGDAVKLSSAEE